jgi:hypothetical protein
MVGGTVAVGDAVVGDSVLDAVDGEAVVGDSVLDAGMVGSAVVGDSVLDAGMVGKAVVGDSVLDAVMVGVAVVGVAVVGVAEVGVAVVGVVVVGDCVLGAVMVGCAVVGPGDDTTVGKSEAWTGDSVGSGEGELVGAGVFSCSIWVGGTTTGAGVGAPGTFGKIGLNLSIYPFGSGGT